jgi:hypothetical protein
MSEVGNELRNDSSAEWMRAQLAELGETQAGLARFLKRNGDDREITNIERSIRRMTAGDARVSGEMRAILGILRKRRQRAVEAAEKLGWQEKEDGSFAVTTHDGFSVLVKPHSGGRWSARVTHQGGADATQRPSTDTLDKAKAVALSMLDEARREPSEEH